MGGQTRFLVAPLRSVQRERGAGRGTATTGANGQGALHRFAAGQIQPGHNYRFRVWVGTTGPATVATTIRFYNTARPKAYPNDTTSDDKVTTCSADYPANVLNESGHLVHHKGDLIYLKPYYHHKPPFTDKERSKVSVLARVTMPDARRWEIGGWKPGAIGGGDSSKPFSASFVLFNGWEGARGPNDCEPLEAALGTGVESYGMIARYTKGSAFALFGSQPSK